MANLVESDLMSLGQHCSHPHCGQLDFLPFTCDCCNQVYCLEHRKYESHACTKANGRQSAIIVCPVCAKAVRLSPGQDANVAFAQHSASDACDPANYAKVHKKAKCPVGNCKEKLTLTNTYRCKDCTQRVCLKHRHGDDHNCSAFQAQQRTAAIASAMRNPLAALMGPRQPQLGTGAAASGSVAAAPQATRKPNPQQLREQARQQYEDPANSVMGTAQRRWEEQRRQEQQRQQQVAATSNANPLVPPPPLPEECPHCRARFPTVQRLIQHVEDFHPTTQQQQQQQQRTPPSNRGSVGSSWQQLSPPPRNSGGSVERFNCPTCSKVFNDAVQLLQHSERCGSKDSPCCVS